MAERFWTKLRRHMIELAVLICTAVIVAFALEGIGLAMIVLIASAVLVAAGLPFVVMRSESPSLDFRRRPHA